MSDGAEFVREIRDALAHLYDFAYLQRHPLAQRLVPPQAETTRTRAQELRRILLDAIEVLNPGDSVPIRAAERRAYAILFGLYVEGRERREVAASLGIGGRQLRRDRAEAFVALASILRDRYLITPTTSAAGDPLRLESERLAQQREPVDLHDLVSDLLPLLESMAGEHGVCLQSYVGPGLPKPCANRTLMRQVLIGLASQALTTLPLARLSFEARPSGAMIGIGLSLEYRQAALPVEGSPTASAPTLDLKLVETLTAALGGRLLQDSPSSEEKQVWVLLPLQEETLVLVVDDNQELFELFQRYVVGQPYHLLHAASADQALDLARSARPDIITLDLMMPNHDGWELLQALRANPATVRIPVVVCSVLKEPELALSLGAQIYLKKPVGQADLLQALGEAKRQAWAEEAR
jgi:CheY-like chemotaxis protein